MEYYMLVGKDSEPLLEFPLASQSKSVLKFVVRDDMIAVLLDCNPDLYGDVERHSNQYRINKGVLALHVIEVHTTKDGWYVPEDKSDWYAIWQPEKDES
jgi:hypothetical protein